MISRSKLFKIAIVLWLTWPGIVAALLRNESHDFFGQALKHYFLYPPSIDHITNHLLLGDLMWKRNYVSAWCFNGYVLMFAYVAYLFKSNSWKPDLEKKSTFKLIFLAAVSLLLSFAFYSEWIFSSEKSLTQKAAVLFNNDIVLVFLFPLVWSMASIFFLSGLAFLYIAVLKFFNVTKDSK